MQRIAFPADVCADPDARYYRTLNDAFLCGAAEAQVFHRPGRRIRYGRWLLFLAMVLALALAMRVASGQRQAAVVEPAPTAQELKMAAASAWVCSGMHADWLDERTVRCLKELP